MFQACGPWADQGAAGSYRPTCRVLCLTRTGRAAIANGPFLSSPRTSWKDDTKIWPMSSTCNGWAKKDGTVNQFRAAGFAASAPFFPGTAAVRALTGKIISDVAAAYGVR